MRSFNITLTPAEGALLTRALLDHELALEKGSSAAADCFPCRSLPIGVGAVISDQMKLSEQIRTRIAETHAASASVRGPLD